MPYKRQSPCRKYSNRFVTEDVTENLRWKSVDGTLKVIYTLGAKPIRKIIEKGANQSNFDTGHTCPIVHLGTTRPCN